MTIRSAITAVALVFVLLSLSPRSGHCQVPQPLYVINSPTAGMLRSATVFVRGRAAPQSSFLAEAQVGFRSRLQLGLSFGMHRLLDYGSPEVNDQVGFKARVRLLQETAAPALAIGFDSQGQGAYYKDVGRYERKSPGIYAVLSKNYALIAGEMSLHGGLNYSTERRDDNNPNFFLGVDWTLFERLSFLLDADAALNDNSEGSQFGQGGIYLDAAVRLYVGESLGLTLIFTDLAENSGVTRTIGREFELTFIQSF